MQDALWVGQTPKQVLGGDLVTSDRNGGQLSGFCTNVCVFLRPQRTAHLCSVSVAGTWVWSGSLIVPSLARGGRHGAVDISLSGAPGISSEATLTDLARACPQEFGGTSRTDPLQGLPRTHVAS